MKNYIVHPEIIKGVKSRFEGRHKKSAQYIKFSAENLGLDLKTFIETEGIKLGDLFKHFQAGKDKLSKRTIGRALRRDNFRLDDGATKELIYLFCIYAFSDNWKDKIYGLGITEDTFRLVSEEIKEESIKSRDKSKISMNSIQPFSTSSEKYKILILPFLNPDRNYETSSLGQNLADRLLQKNKLEKLGLEIKYWGTYIDDLTNDKAQMIGENLKADMVIWGNDSKPIGNTSHRIYFHYLNITADVDIDKIPKEGVAKAETDRLVEINEGNLQLEIDDVINWFVGNKYYQSCDYYNAIRHFEKISHVKYQNEHISLYLALSYFRFKKIWKSIFYYNEALRCNPNSIVAHVNLGNIYSDLHNAKRLAKKHYKKALNITQESWVAHSGYAFLLETQFNDIELAKYHYEKALKIHPYVATFSNYANLLAGLDNISAEENYLKALEIDPNFVLAYCCYARFLTYELNDKIKAQEYYQKALEIDPGYALAHLGYAILLVTKFNEEKESKRHFEKSIEINSSFAVAHLNYAIFLKQKFNEINKAKDHYRKAIKIDPQLRSISREVFFENSKPWALLMSAFLFIFRGRLNSKYFITEDIIV